MSDEIKLTLDISDDLKEEVREIIDDLKKNGSEYLLGRGPSGKIGICQNKNSKKFNQQCKITKYCVHLKETLPCGELEEDIKRNIVSSRGCLRDDVLHDQHEFTVVEETEDFTTLRCLHCDELITINGKIDLNKLNDGGDIPGRREEDPSPIPRPFQRRQDRDDDGGSGHSRD